MKRRTQIRIKYKLWCRQTEEDYGFITNYIFTIINNRRQGIVICCINPIPFADPDDYKILWNGLPYSSLEAGVKHLAIRLKLRLPVDPETGKILPENSPINDFVDKTFVRRLRFEGIEHASARVCWSKSGYGLQNVGQLEPIHVLLKDIPA
ncbi:hypothetical protein MMC17_005566 [Xylographa soralifera]|nr:hypothetical protein [Xylographa soralifera]